MTNYWPTIYLVLWYTQIKWIGNNIDHPNYSVPFAKCFSPAVDHIWNRLKDMKSIRKVMAKSFSGWKAPIQSFDSQGSAGILLLKLLASELPKLLVNFISSVLRRSCWIWGAKMSPGTGGTATFSPTGATSLAKVACTVAGHSEISSVSNVSSVHFIWAATYWEAMHHLNHPKPPIGWRSQHSMDWFKGKLEPESPIFNGKIYGFLQNFP